MDKNGIMKDEGEKEWVVDFFFYKVEVTKYERGEKGGKK